MMVDSLGAENGRGILFVFSAPSGAGKTTLARFAVKRIPGIRQSVSYTTRPRRDGEDDGEAYHFVDNRVFREMISQNAFIEYAEVHGEYYGTPLESIERAKVEKTDLLLVIDVQGARKIQEKKIDAVFIFVLPPSLKELERRLSQRGTENRNEVMRRLETAKLEILLSAQYDYLVINDSLEEAEKEMEVIIRAERCRMRRRSLDFPDYSIPSCENTPEET